MSSQIVLIRISMKSGSESRLNSAHAASTSSTLNRSPSITHTQSILNKVQNVPNKIPGAHS